MKKPSALDKKLDKLLSSSVNAVKKDKMLSERTHKWGNMDVELGKVYTNMNAFSPHVSEESTIITERLKLPLAQMAQLLPAGLIKGNDHETRDRYKRLLVELAKTLNAFYNKHSINVEINTKMVGGKFRHSEEW